MSTVHPPDSDGGSESPVTAHNVDLSNCDRELIQYSGAIQPHGALLVVQEPALRILQASANAEALLGIAAEALRTQDVAVVLGAEPTQVLQARLARETLTRGPVYVLRVRPPSSQREVQVFAHRSDGVLLLELEVIPPEAPTPLSDLYAELQGCIAQLQDTPSLQAFFDLAVGQLRRFTGFDRVMAYRFDEDGSGAVIAEAVRDDLEPYLGLHYPASDIPAPAKRLFSLRWLSHLPDADYTPVPLVPELNPSTGQPLDLSHSFLRSVSVMYSAYLRNMGVKATLVLTLLKNGRLWGLISCMHHAAPRHVPYEVRVAVEFLAHLVSLLMAAKEEAEQYEYRLKLGATLDRLVEAMAQAPTFHDGLVRPATNVLTTLDAHGAALVIGDRVTLLGQTPTEAEVAQLAAWLAGRPEPVFATHHLAGHYPPAVRFTAQASGLLAARLSRTQADSVLWFRPEVIQEVHWAGDPRKPVEVSEEGGEVRLMPRTSFALWQETVSGTSRPWADCERQYAADVRRAVLEVIVGQAEALSRLNRELEQSNVELDAFAYVASHDLKEPLRGIHNYAHFLQVEEAGRLSAGGQARLETILRLTQRMDDLIDSLFQYSRVGRVELAFHQVALQDVLTQTLDLLRAHLEDGGVIVRVPRPLPVVACDRVRVAEVFNNLLINAIKYNDKTERWIEVGYEDTDPPVFYVRDNGIGIAPEDTEQIFQIFRRLHGRDAYGGGSGAGLTITKKVVERHGGRLWVVSTPGEGSTFFFTLAPGGGRVWPRTPCQSSG
ncbi:MAG: ATP-binding protein [Candidatus Tectimicrobiota bacterium]